MYRVPNVYGDKLIKWADERGKTVKEIDNGFLIQKRGVIDL